MSLLLTRGAGLWPEVWTPLRCIPCMLSCNLIREASSLAPNQLTGGHSARAELRYGGVGAVGDKLQNENDICM